MISKKRLTVFDGKKGHVALAMNCPCGGRRLACRGAVASRKAEETFEIASPLSGGGTPALYGRRDACHHWFMALMRVRSWKWSLAMNRPEGALRFIGLNVRKRLKHLPFPPIQ